MQCFSSVSTTIVSSVPASPVKAVGLNVSHRFRLSPYSSIAIVISRFLERHSKANLRARTYSRALGRIRGVVQREVKGKLRFDFQRVSGDKGAVKVGVV